MSGRLAVRRHPFPRAKRPRGTFASRVEQLKGRSRAMFPGLPDLRRFDELDGKTFVVCVGAMKCATSWIHNYLEMLDGVAVSALKELHFFNIRFPANALGDMDALALKRLAFHLAREGDQTENLLASPAFRASVDRVQMIYDDDAYFAHFARLVDAGTRTLCDVTPAYSVIGQTGFEYMKAFFASQDVKLKLVYVMRDPVDRLWSQLRHMQQMKPDSEITRKWQEAIESPRICARADYRGTVWDLDAVFPADDLLYLFYEDLFTDAALHRLCDFAGAEFRPGETGKAQNRTSVEVDLPDDARAAFHGLLAPQYAFCRERFGDRVPASWAG
jgi:hypothetical protein